MHRIIPLFFACLILLTALPACRSQSQPADVEPATAAVSPEAVSSLPSAAAAPLPTVVTATPVPTETPAPTPSVTPTLRPSPTFTPPPLNAAITVDVRGPGQSFSPYLLGSNLPAWLKRETFENAAFRARVAAAGLTLIRIPGGSWGDELGWLSCEMGQDVPGAVPCQYPWAARPTDFINFFRGLADLGAHPEPMYIVNVNYTAQEAAALVAFFNADIGDPTVIGVDRNGVDWKTAGHWAALRAEHGNPQPLRIHWWEIGNEIYGGRTGGKACGANGWEATWTCDGTEYIQGIAGHDGFLQMRAAMRAVDPAIQVGAVGGTEAVMGSRWSEAVIRAGVGQIDYFVLHTYPSYYDYRNPAKEYREILTLPQTLWPRLADSVNAAFQYYNEGQTIPVVVNEYEIVPAYGRQDYRNYMNKHIDALFIADSIGQMAQLGIHMAAQWDIMNGKSDDFGNEFGLMRADGTNDRQPKYWAFPLWSRFGTTLLPVKSSARPESELSVYAGRLADGTITLMVINKTGAVANVELTLDGAAQIVGGLADVLTAPSLDAPEAVFNGVANPADDYSDAPSLPLEGTETNRLNYTFAPQSVTLLRLTAR